MADEDEQDSANRSTKDVVVSFLQWQGYLCKHFLFHTLNDIRKNKVNYSLGFFACFLVVFVVSLVVTIIGNTPVVFLRLAEQQVGEQDMYVSSGPWNNNDRLNYTMIQSILEPYPQFTYHSPRHIIRGASIVPARGCDSYLNPYDPTWKYSTSDQNPGGCTSCFSQHCSFSEVDTDLFVIDSEKEKRMVLGRDWSDRPPVKEGYVYMHKTLARDLGVGVGDIVYLKFSFQQFLRDVYYKAISASSIYIRPDIEYAASFIYAPFKIQGVFTDGSGKFGHNQDMVTVAEYSTFLGAIVASMDPNLGTQTLEYLNRTNLYENAHYVNFNLPPNRVPNYINTNQDEINQVVVQWASQILYRIGFNVISARLVVLGELSNSAIISLFLGLILNIIIFILLFLSIILIYSLLMINVETKTFEMGVMRMIGITRRGLVQLLLFQAFSYSIPSWVAGLILSQLFGVFVASWFEGITGVPISPVLTSNAVLMATGLGLLIPIVASILPIRNALGRNLHDSLDTNRSKTQAVQVTIDRAEDNTFSVPVLIIGFALATFGFGVYYVFPLSLLSMNFALLLNMFFFLLIAMLFGMVLLSLNLGQMLETFVVWAFFFWENASIPQVVLKNLVAHKIRNRKTTIMYALSLGFIIFINVTYEMQESSMTYDTQRVNGAYIKVKFSYDPAVPQPIYARSRLEALALEHPKIENFAWVSQPLRFCSPNIVTNEISNLGHLYRDNSEIYAVSPNFFEVAIPGFLNIHKFFHDPDFNLGSENELAYQMYSEEGSKSMIIGTKYESFMGLGKPYSHLLMDTTFNTSKITHTRLKPSVFLDSAPIFTFSKFPSTTNQGALISFTSFVRLSAGYVQSVEHIQMMSFLVKMVDGASDTDKDDVVDALKAYARTVPNASVFDYRTIEDPLEVASVVLQYFFQFTTVVAMLISFFSLMSSMFTNIHEQVKEIGILRAIGIGKGAMYRIYMYEAFVLVFASSLLGILIGTTVGYTVLLQRILFTQLPIPFIFPTQLLIVVFVFSIFFAILAAFGPIRSVISKPIVNTLRGG
eukprot:Phypoly_transcript_01699.p1 GENE.Phypoly_transcript_01699~~Phypoly_transcript_01699.p1  ORF type:complete len:1053 (-),score=137.59 Phypoly_transcript_01699:52-3186(-)